MDIDYCRLSKDINEFGKDILQLIKAQYESSMSISQQQFLEKLTTSDNFIVINKPNSEDVERFGKLNDSNHNIPNAPSAHGGRAKGDGKIHIYPYSQSFNNCNTYDDYLNLCKNHLVVHEIFHYFIRPDAVEIKNSEIYNEFKHFLTEGLVQYYTETFSKEHNLVIPNSNYNWNVKTAKDILSVFPKGTDLDKIVFQKNFVEIINLAYNYSGINFVNNYIQEKQKYNYLETIIIEAGREANLNEIYVNKIVDSKMRAYKSMSNHEQIIEDYQYQISKLFKDEKLLAKYNEKVKQYNPKAFENLQNKKKKVKSDLNIKAKQTNTNVNLHRGPLKSELHLVKKSVKVINDKKNKVIMKKEPQISKNQSAITHLKLYREKLKNTEKQINNVNSKNNIIKKETPKILKLTNNPNSTNKGFVDILILAVVTGFGCGIGIGIGYFFYKICIW